MKEFLKLFLVLGTLSINQCFATNICPAEIGSQFLSEGQFVENERDETIAYFVGVWFYFGSPKLNAVINDFDISVFKGSTQVLNFDLNSDVYVRCIYNRQGIVLERRLGKVTSCEIEREGMVVGNERVEPNKILTFQCE